MRLKSVVVAALAAVLLPIGAAAQELPSARELVDRLDDLYRSNSSHSMMTMTVVRQRGPRTLTLESWTRGDDEALIVIREPAREAGTATLRNDDGLWNYAPRADRLIRIPSGLLSDGWMGSHFTNDDLLRETSYLDDHEASVSWTDYEGERVVRVEMIPAPTAPVVYTSMVFLLSPTNWVPLRTDYYDADELVRSMVFDQVRVIQGKSIPLRLVLLPAEEEDGRTEIVYDVLELEVAVDPDLFTRRGLRRVATN